MVDRANAGPQDIFWASGNPQETKPKAPVKAPVKVQAPVPVPAPVAPAPAPVPVLAPVPEVQETPKSTHDSAAEVIKGAKKWTPFMKKEELAAFARAKGITVPDNATKNEIIGLLKAAEEVKPE